MNGSVEEDTKLKQDLVAKGVLIPLQKYDTCFLARTDPRDVARVESRTVLAFTQTLTGHYYVLVDLTIGLSTKIYR